MLSLGSNRVSLFSLILQGVLNAMLEHNDVADLCFETVTSEDPENVIAWTLYGRLDEFFILIFLSLQRIV